MMTRSQIKEQAKLKFRSQYGLSIAALLLMYVLSACATATFVGALLLVPPLAVGYVFFFLKVYHGETGDIQDLFNGFKNYARNLGGILWMELFVFLWSLLFIIPGIVKALSYFMTPYILADCPNVSATDALKLSMRMTKGYKGKIFVMGLSFIGWMILSCLTGMILYVLYVGPYMDASFAGLYDELKKNALAKGVVNASELA